MITKKRPMLCSHKVKTNTKAMSLSCQENVALGSDSEEYIEHFSETHKLEPRASVTRSPKQEHLLANKKLNILPFVKKTK